MGSIVSAVAGPVLSTVGGLIGGSKASQAANQQATAFRDAATYGRDQAAFQPFGITTGFGSSNFGIDPTTGRVTSAGYALDPRLASLQNNIYGNMAGYDPAQVGQAAQPLYGGASSLFNLGQQYLATSPQQAAQDYYNSQQGLLASGRSAEDARLASANFGRGTGGLAVQTGTGTAPSNPLAQALYNARGQQDLQLAAQADQAGMDRARFGAGLFGTGGQLLGQVPALTSAGYDPLRTQLGLFSDIEKLGMTPYEMSLGLGKTISDAGARQGEIVMGGERAAAPSSLAYNSYSPMGTALSGIGSTVSNMGGNWFGSLIGSGGGGSTPMASYAASNPNVYGGGTNANGTTSFYG